MKKAAIIAIFAAGLILGILAAYICLQPENPKLKADIESDIKELYALANPDTDIDIVSTTEYGQMYKIVLKSTGITGTTYTETYTTKDGTFMAENMILIENYTQELKAAKDFAYCLNSKGIKIYGVTNYTQSPEGAEATVAQLNLLGMYSGMLFLSCDNELAQPCIDNGITTVPSVLFDGEIHPGIKTPQQLGELTGCTI